MRYFGTSESDSRSTKSEANDANARAQIKPSSVDFDHCIERRISRPDVRVTAEDGPFCCVFVALS